MIIRPRVERHRYEMLAYGLREPIADWVQDMALDHLDALQIIEGLNKDGVSADSFSELEAELNEAEDKADEMREELCEAQELNNSLQVTVSDLNETLATVEDILDEFEQESPELKCKLDRIRGIL